MKRVARLMRENGIRAKQRRKFRGTTGSKHSHPVAPNLLERDVDASASNPKWVADITYIPTRDGWLYLVVILDLYPRMIVGWSMSSRMARRLVPDALDMALAYRRSGLGVLQRSFIRLAWEVFRPPYSLRQR